MNEIFRNAGVGQPAALPRQGTTGVESEQMAWQPTGVDGFWIKPLFEDKESGQRTWLMKVDPGASAPMHAHDELEQIFVLEGSFYDQTATYRAGDYAIRAPATAHTAGSEDGATVLLVYSS